MSYTIRELNEAVTEGFRYSYLNTRQELVEYDVSGWGELVEALFWTDSANVELDGIGTITGIEDHGGGEGSGEERWFVFKVTDSAGEERVFRRNGYYASFYGSDFDGPTEEVYPVQKTVTVWEAK